MLHDFFITLLWVNVLHVLQEFLEVVCLKRNYTEMIS